jgi:hypothetical protein
MTLTKFPALLIVALSLAGAGCGSDNDQDNTPSGDGDGDGDGKPDSGPSGDGDGDGDGGGMVSGDPACKAGGIFDGHKYTDVKAKLHDQGACLADTDVQEACVVNPSDAAGTAGRMCLSLAGAAFEKCVADGIQKVATNLSDACTNCYVQTVVCSKMMCIDKCADPMNVDECAQCRVDKGCTAAFYMCSGFPTPDELK